VLIGEAAARPAGEVVGNGAVGDGHGAVAGVADAAAAATASGRPKAPSREGLIVAHGGPCHGHRRPHERSAHLNGVDVDTGTLVYVRVAGDHRAAIDDDRARTVGVDAAASVAGVVVANNAIVDRQRPAAVRRVLHHHAAAVGGRVIIGDDHVCQG